MPRTYRQFKYRLAQIYDRYKHLLLLLYFPLYLLWFNYLEKAVTTRFHVVHVAADSYIPFCEYFVVPYLLWFFYVGWGVLYMATHDRSDYYRLCAFLFTGMTVFLIASTIYPNGHYLRPQYFAHHNVFTALCELLYAGDTPTNLFPSIHVYNSLGIHFAVMNNRDLRKNKTAQMLSFLLMASIILATMFIKQHSLFDVLTAIALGLVMYQAVYRHSWAIRQSSRGWLHLR